MKIALINPPFFRSPPLNYGGAEVVTWNLANGLTKLGHKVVVFGANGSQQPENGFVVEYGEELGEKAMSMDWRVAEKQSFDKFKHLLDDFDVIHDHTWFAWAYTIKQSGKYNVCHTHHGHINWNPATKPSYVTHLIAISKFMQALYKKLGWNAEYAYNSIDTDLYSFKKDKGKRLCYVGRFDSFKQPLVALEVAKACDMPIDLIGGSKFIQDPAYYQNLVDEVKKYPKARILADISTEEKIPYMQDAKAVLVPSKMCIPTGYEVLTPTTVKDIKSLRVGNTVLSHDGKWHTVSETTSREYVGELREITPFLFNLPLKLTPNHRIWSARREKTWASRPTPSITRDQPNSIRINKPEWIPCGELEQCDYICTPIPRSRDLDDLDLINHVDSDPKKRVCEVGGLLHRQYYNKLVKQWTRHQSNGLSRYVKLTPSFLRMLGYYIAEGSCTGNIIFNFGNKDEDMITDLSATCGEMGLSYHIFDRFEHNTKPLTIYNTVLRQIFENWFGKNAREKHIPKWLFDLPSEKIWHLIHGMWKGDGCCRQGNGFDYFEYSTASKTLAIQTWLLLVKLGIIGQLSTRLQPTGSFGCGKSIYRLTITGKYVEIMAKNFGCKLTGKQRTRTHEKGFFYNDHVYLPIRKISNTPFKGIVHNLEVDGSKSFLCEGITVHNSEPFGLVAAEANSCGTPTIVLNDGALPEVISDGATGFVCNTTLEMINAVKHIYRIVPEACRNRAVIKFSRKVMAERYLSLYERMLKGEVW